MENDPKLLRGNTSGFGYYQKNISRYAYKYIKKFDYMYTVHIKKIYIHNYTYIHTTHKYIDTHQYNYIWSSVQRPYTYIWLVVCPLSEKDPSAPSPPTIAAWTGRCLVHKLGNNVLNSNYTMLIHIKSVKKPSDIRAWKMHPNSVELHFQHGISWNFCGFSKPFWNITTKDEHVTGATDTGATNEFPADLPDPEVGDLPEAVETYMIYVTETSMLHVLYIL